MTLKPAFALDPDVPQRDLLLDTVGLGSRLDALLGERAPAGIVRVEQLHVRYRVGRGVGLLLRVDLGRDSRLVSARSFQPGRARSNYERALQTSSAPIAGLRAVSYAPELETVFWTFPRDRSIGSLELLKGPSDALAALVGRPCTPQLAAYVPEKAATARCLDERGRALAYVKLYARSEREGGASSHSFLASLHEALAETGTSLRIPRALGYDGEHCAVAVQAIDGESLSVQSDTTRPAHLAGLGVALATLHSVPLPDGVEPFERLSPERLSRAAELIARVRPDVARAAFELADRLAASYEQDGAPVCLHGDVHGKNVLSDGASIALVDLDQAGLGPAAADLGSVLGGLRYLRCVGQLPGARERGLADGLLDGYRSARPLPSPQALSWHMAAALLGERAIRSVTRVRPAGLSRLGELLESGLRALRPPTRAGGHPRPTRDRGKPSVLLYCQHAIGLGHLTRSLSLAGALAGRFNVALLSGGVVPRHVTPPPGVELVALPPLILADGGGLLSPDPARTVEQAKAVRARILAEAVRTHRPAVVVVEMFPFGRRAFADEIVAMLKRSRALPEGPPLIASSVRDILVGRGSEQAAYDERACRLANANFDLILVHCDPRFATLEESFRPATDLRVPVRHTGFIAAPRPAAAPPRRPVATVVVSAGGGRVGEPLLQAAVDAYPRLRRECDVEMRVIAGPFLPADAWRRLRASADGLDGLVVLREVADLGAELAAGAVSISQCGYNTALDVLKSGIAALVVPYVAPGEDEQLRRAQRLAALGAVRLLHPRALGGGEIARHVESLLGTVAPDVELDLDGADASAELLWQSLERARPRAQAVIA